MGYRLTIMTPDTEEILNVCKFFGYVSDADLKKSRSLRWLIDNHKLGDYNPAERWEGWIWHYGASHEMYLRHSEFIEFITLYVMDRNEFYFDGDKDCIDGDKDCIDCIDYYEEALKLPWVKVGWY